jgi:hypothetical protein
MLDCLMIEKFAGPAATVFASLVAAVFAAAQFCVAKAQKDIAYDNLKFALFEKQNAIYLAAKELIEYIREGKGGRLEDVDLIREHYIALDEARFFFEPEIQDLLTNVEKECEGYLTTVDEKNMMNPEDDPEAYREKAQQAANRMKKLNEMYASLPKRFERALAFKQVTNRNF